MGYESNMCTDKYDMRWIRKLKDESYFDYRIEKKEKEKIFFDKAQQLQNDMGKEIRK